MKKLKLISLTLAATFLLSACQSADDTTQTQETNQPQETQKQQQEKEIKAKKVETFTVGKSLAPKSVSSTNNQPKKVGIVESFQKVTIKSEVGGKVDKILASEGQTIDPEKPIIILGSSLNADIQDINFQNALISLKNAEEQLEAKREANKKSLKNTKLTIDQSTIQLETAHKSRANLDRSTNLSVNQLVEQNQNSYYSVVEHIRDVASLGRTALEANPNASGYSEIENQVNYLEDGINYNRNSTNPNELNDLIRVSESLLSNLKSYTSDTYTNYGYDYRGSTYYDNRYYNNSSNPFSRNRYIDYFDNEPYYNNDDSDYISRRVTDSSQPPSYGSTTTGQSTSTTNTTPTTDPNIAIQTRINQLLPATTQYKSTLLQFEQGLEKTDDSYITQSTTADSQLALAEVQLENARQLFELKKVQIQLEEQQLEDQIEQLAGQVALADRNRKTREISAPFAGTLISKLVEEGEQINPGQAVAEIGTTDKLKVVVKVTQSEIEELRPKQKVTVINSRNEPIEGTIISLPVSFDSQTKTGKVEIEVKNDPIKFIPGMTVNVSFTPIENDSEKEVAEKLKEGIWIPLSTVYFQDETYIFIAENDKAKKQIVSTGAITNNMIEIEKGLKKDDQVILNRFEITDGIKVEVK